MHFFPITLVRLLIHILCYHMENSAQVRFVLNIVAVLCLCILYIYICLVARCFPIFLSCVSLFLFHFLTSMLLFSFVSTLSHSHSDPVSVFLFSQSVNTEKVLERHWLWWSDMLSLVRATTAYIQGVPQLVDDISCVCSGPEGLSMGLLVFFYFFQKFEKKKYGAEEKKISIPNLKPMLQHIATLFAFFKAI